MKVKLIKIEFLSNELRKSNIPKFRGFLSNKYPNYDLIHNHLSNGNFRYSYPQIQFKTTNKHPAILGIDKGIYVLKKVFLELDEMKIGNKVKNIEEKSIRLIETDFGVANEFLQYKFLSPWMALNQKNYKKYVKLNEFKQQQFLKHLLRENLKTISKGFDYLIPDINTIEVDGEFKQKNVNFKNLSMLCFIGHFKLNFYIPNYLGIGKQVARGFGMVKRTSR